MPQFAYKAQSRDGGTSAGRIDAADRQHAVRQLRARGLTPIQLNAAPGADVGAFFGRLTSGLRRGAAQKDAAAPGKSAIRGGANRQGIGLQLLKRLMELHNSGMPVGDAIRVLSQRLTEPRLKQLAQTLWRDLSEGFTFAEAVRRQPVYFTESIGHVIAAGEATGNLGPVLAKVVVYLEERAAIRRKMLSSLAYPAFICAVAIIVVIGFLTFLLPQIEGMLTRLGSDMSFSARILIDGSAFALNVGPFLLVGIIIGAIAVLRWRTTGNGRLRTDRWVLEVPLIGPIIRLGELFQTCSLIGTLLNSGINTTETLQLTEQTLQNRHLREQFRRARVQVNEGTAVAAALRKHEFMPDIALDILSVGEDTGNLAHSMDEITRGFRDKLSIRIDAMIGLVTTGALVCAFVLVGLVAMGIVTSIFEVSRGLSN